MLNKGKLSDMLDYALLCSEQTGVNFENLYNDCLNTVKYYEGSKEVRFANTHPLKLQERWYDSLAQGNPDYSVYQGVEMLSDMWACWKIYSREYIKSMVSQKAITCTDSDTNEIATKSILSEVDVKRVLDLGCGVGYTTAALTQVFPHASVYATNVDSGYQVSVARHMASVYNFNLTTSLNNLPSVDLVFASEYFEHFEDPIAHLNEVLSLNPKYMIIANAFSAKSVGHFDEYLYNGVRIKGKQFGKVFNKYLRDHGYINVKTNFYNNRPMYWKKGS